MCQVVAGEAEVAQFVVGPRAGQGEHVVDVRPGAVPLQEFQGDLVGVGGRGDPGEPGASTGRHHQGPTDRGGGVERGVLDGVAVPLSARSRRRVNGAGSARVPLDRSPPAVRIERERVRGGPQPAEELGTVCGPANLSPTDATIGVRACHERECQADRGLVRRPGPAPEQQGIGLAGDGVRLDEELAERGVAQVGLLVGQDDLGEAGDGEPTRPVGVVDDLEPTQLDGVLGRDGDLEQGPDAVADGPVLGAGGVEDGGLGGPLPQRRRGGRPALAAVEVGQVAPGAPVLHGRVGPPPGQRRRPAGAVPAAGTGHEDAVGAVGKPVDARAPALGRHPRRGVPDRGGRTRGVRLADDRQRRLRHLRQLLADQHRHPRRGRLGVEPLDHPRPVESLGEGEQDHPLVMGHVRLDQGELAPERHP